MFESIHAILTEPHPHRPGRITVSYHESGVPFERLLVRRLRRLRVFENLASELEKLAALGDLTIRVGAPAGGTGLQVDLSDFLGWLLESKLNLEEACLQAACRLGTELARQVGRQLNVSELQRAA